MPALELLPYPEGGKCPRCGSWLYLSHIAFNGGQPTHFECRACKLNYVAKDSAWSAGGPQLRSRVPGEDDD